MTAVTITAGEYAGSQKARDELSDMLLEGTTGGGTILGPLRGLTGVPDAMLDMYEVVHLSLLRRIKPTAAFANTAGALPITSSTFTSTGGTLMMLFSGTGYHGTGGALIGIDAQVDGVTKGSAQIYANAANTHCGFSSCLLVTGITAGSHTITFIAKAGTLSDSNDRFSCMVIEMPS